MVMTVYLQGALRSPIFPGHTQTVSGSEGETERGGELPDRQFAQRAGRWISLAHPISGSPSSHLFMLITNQLFFIRALLLFFSLKPQFHLWTVKSRQKVGYLASSQLKWHESMKRFLFLSRWKSRQIGKWELCSELSSVLFSTDYIQYQLASSLFIGSLPIMMMNDGLKRNTVDPGS